MTRTILFLGSQMAIGGAQRLLQQQAQWFQDQGYQVTAAFLYDKEGCEAQWHEQYGVSLVNLRARRVGAGFLGNALQLPTGLWRAWRLMRKGHFDAIETFTHHSNFLILIAWLAGIPVRVASHQGRILGFPRILEILHAWVVNHFSCGIIAVSDRVAQECLKEGIRPEQVHVVTNGTSLPALENFDRQAYRAQLGLNPQHMLVISVGRLTQQKAHTYLVQAAPAVLARFPQTRFAVAGDGPLHAELQAEIQALGLQDVFTLLGARQDVPQLLGAADLFALPSRSEGLPVAMLEAMTMGLPVVATAAQGVDQVLRGGQNGLLVPLEDPQALAQGLCELLGDAQKRERLAETGRKLVMAEYSLDTMCRRIQALLDPGQAEGFS